MTGKLGRPRAFCEDTALEAAMRVFWEKGYEGATLTDLTDAMGINRSSMYATFGDKDALFRLAIARYAHGPAGYVQEALKQPTAKAVTEALLKGAVEMLSEPQNPRGCLSVQGALACGADAEPLKQAMIQLRKKGEAEVQKRLEQAQADGDLSKDIDPGHLARYIAAILTGIGVQAANGATKEEMAGIADLTLGYLPF